MMRTELELLLPEIAAEAPGFVASVRRGGRTLLRCGRGLAHLDAGTPNTPAGTRMRIASTSKHFVCLLVLMLRDEGRLSLDESIAPWLPELPPAQARLTPRQLMSHTAGLRDFLDLSLLSNGMTLPLPDEALLASQCRQGEAVNFEPGSAFAYSNAGYRLLSLLLERECGRPLADLLRERLFAPLAMDDTLLWPDDLRPLAGGAQTHVAQPDGSFRKGVFPCTTLGEGGIASTVDDMQRWMDFLRRSPLFDEMCAPSVLANGHRVGYGMGLIAETLHGVSIVHHAGGIVGGTSQMLIAPAQDLQIAVMTNRGDLSAPELAQKLLLAALGIEPPRGADIEAGGLLGRHFFCAENGRHHAIEKIGERWVLRHFGMPLPLVAGEADALRVDSAVTALEARAIDGGEALEVFEQGRRYRCARIVPPDEGPGAAAGFDGRWHSEELEAAIAIEDGLMTVQGPHGRSRFRLQPVGDRLALLAALDLAIPFGGTLRRTDAGELLLDTARTRGLRLRPGRAAPP